jgi:uncharacterized membrane protein
VSATPPRARIKYSRVRGASRAPDSAASASSTWARAVATGILVGGVLGALLLVVSEFTTLYSVHTTNGGFAVGSVPTHAHDFFALIPIAVLVVVLSVGAGTLGSRLALVGLGAIALVTLGIVLIGDLPDAQATGTVIFLGRYRSAVASPATGFYLETLGAVLLLVVAGCGLVLTAPPWRAAVLGARRPS